MAEPSNVAFGRYLKMLRERRNLSLDDVYVRSQSFPETLQKGYISRVENGHQKLAFAKMIPLSRILEVPSDVLVERMELDLELDKVGGPETAGKDFATLLESGNESIRNGNRWEAYGFFRDSVPIAKTSPLRPSYRDAEEQLAMALLGLASLARQLGRLRYSLHELECLRIQQVVSDRYLPFVFRELSASTGALGETDRSSRFAERAVQMVDEQADPTVASAVYQGLALRAMEERSWSEAIRHHRRAHSVFKRMGSPLDQARTLNNMAECYLQSGNPRAARRLVGSSRALLGEVPHRSAFAHSEYILGELAIHARDVEKALRHLRRASDIARRLNDKMMRFKIDLLLFEISIDANKQSSMRVLEKRLTRLSAWVPRNSEHAERLAALRARMATSL